MFKTLSIISLACITLIYANTNIHKYKLPDNETITIIDKPIEFHQKRINMTKDYISKHYDIKSKDINIVPKIIVLHWTAQMDFDKSFNRLKPQKLLSDRKDISSASALNVSAHFLVDRDGKIYRLMPETYMARHVIGLNYYSIGIENVGGYHNKKDDLTKAQLESNIKLVRYLKIKYPTIEYIIGHHEYRQMEKTPLWLEKDKNYRTIKHDPGSNFMYKVRSNIKDLHLKKPPK